MPTRAHDLLEQLQQNKVDVSPLSVLNRAGGLPNARRDGESQIQRAGSQFSLFMSL
jgi:hypothetical protein